MWLTFIIALFGIAGAVVALVILWKEAKEKPRWHRSLSIIGASCSLCVLIAQGIQQPLSDVSHSRESANMQKQYDGIKEQNDSLLTEVRGLTATNEELKGMLNPVIMMAKGRNPELEDKKAVEMFVGEIQRILNPKLVFLEDRTRTKKDDETGMWTIYTWTSQYPVTIRDVSVKLRFDTIVLKSAFNLVNMLPFSHNGTLSIDPDRKGVRFYARTLEAGCDIVISVFTETPPRILSSEFSP